MRYMCVKACRSSFFAREHSKAHYRRTEAVPLGHRPATWKTSGRIRAGPAGEGGVGAGGDGRGVRRRVPVGVVTGAADGARPGHGDGQIVGVGVGDEGGVGAVLSEPCFLAHALADCAVPWRQDLLLDLVAGADVALLARIFGGSSGVWTVFVDETP